MERVALTLGVVRRDDGPQGRSTHGFGDECGDAFRPGLADDPIEVGRVVGARATVAVRVGQRERRQFLAVAPMLVQRYGLTAAELEMFSDWGRMLAVRRSLPRSKRRTFDGVHAGLARLAVLHARPGVNPADEARLVNLLYEARAAAS